jgi:arylsulfatase A-like enzyme/SAM-dependent methyltransferase
MSLRRIILVSCDALRWDALGCVEDKRYWEARGLADRLRTPTLDALAAGGVRCTQAATPAPYTSSAHASLLTGLLPARHGCRGAFYHPMRDKVPTLPQVLKRHGFTTVLSSDVRFFFDLLDIGRGFDHRFSRDDAAFLKALQPFREGRLFLLAHCMDTNNPYGYSDGAAMGAANAAYFRTLQGLVDRYMDGREVPADRPDKYHTWCAVKRRMLQAGARDEVVRLYLDGVVQFDGGRLRWLVERLGELGLLEEALVVVLGDHGEGDYEQDFAHSLGLIEDVIRIPLLLSAPGVLPEGVTLDRPVSLVDVVPTVLDLLGLEAEPEVWTHGLDGESLMPMLRGAAVSPRATVTEVWRHRDGVVPFMERCKTTGLLAAPDYSCFLWQRAVRTAQAKYVLLGKRIPSPDDAIEPARLDLRRLPDTPPECAGELLFDLGADREDRQDVAAALGDAIPGDILATCRAILAEAEQLRGAARGPEGAPARLRVNLGCGDDRRAGYLNVDGYAAGADRRMDMLQLEFADGSVDAVFSAHALEHLGKGEVVRALAEIRRVLRAGGRLVLNLPDLEWCMRHWLSLSEAERWGWPLDTIFGLQTHPGEYHKTGFTGSRVAELLTGAGFDRVHVLPFWSHGQQCLWVEACAPGRRDDSPSAERARPEAQPRLSAMLLVRDEIDLIDAYLDNTVPFVDELVVIEGGSTDGTLERIQARRDPKIRLEVWPQDAPAYTAGWREPDRRNRALELATGAYVLKKDVDEFFLEGDYARIREWMVADAEVLHVFPRLNFWGEAGRVRVDTPQDPHWWPDPQGNLWAKRLGIAYGPEPLHCRMVRPAGPMPPSLLHEDVPIFHYHWAAGKRVKVNDLRWRDLVADPGRIPSALAGQAPPPELLDFTRPHVATREYRGAHPQAVGSLLVPRPAEAGGGIGEAMAAYLHVGPEVVEAALASRAQDGDWGADVVEMFEEIRAWRQGRHAQAVRPLEDICRETGVQRVLVYGCGIGEEAVCLARLGLDVTAMDRPLGSLRFARYRAERSGVPVTFLSDTGVYPAPETYDALLALVRPGRESSSAGVRRALACVRAGGLCVTEGAGGEAADAAASEPNWAPAPGAGPWRVWRRRAPAASGGSATAGGPREDAGVVLRIACALCGAAYAEVIGRQGEARLLRCLGCGLVFFSPVPDRAALGSSYDRPSPDLQEELRRVLDGALPDAQVAEIEALAPKGGRLLDVGCAYGAFLLAARRRNWSVTGFEISPQCVTVARDRLGLTVVCGDRLEEADLPPASFDVVRLQHVLEHVPDPVRLIESARRLLAPGGLLWVATPNFASFAAGILGNEWGWVTYPNHLQYFTPQTLLMALNQAGFRSVRLRSRTAADQLDLVRSLLARLDETQGLTGCAAFVATLDRHLRGAELIAAARTAEAEAARDGGGGAPAVAVVSDRKTEDDATGPASVATVDRGSRPLAAGDGELPADVRRAIQGAAARTKQPGLSAHLIVRNEADLIDLYLDNTLPYVDELVILEGGSTDGTLERIRARGSEKIRLVVWPQESAQFSRGWREPDRRNAAIDLTTRQWILKKDADEFFREEDFLRLRSLLQGPQDRLICFPRLNFWGDPEHIRLDTDADPHWHPDYQGNLWPASLGLRWSNVPLHCQLERAGRVFSRTENHDEIPIYHYHWAIGKRVKVNDLRRGDLVEDRRLLPSEAADQAVDLAHVRWDRAGVRMERFVGQHPESIERSLGLTAASTPGRPGPAAQGM